MKMELTWITGSTIRPYIIIFFLVSVILAFSLSYDFLYLDDRPLIVNAGEQDFSLSEIRQIFSTPLGKPHDSVDDSQWYIYYRPLLNVLYLVNKKVWGCNPVGFHLTNMLFHLLSSFLVYQIGLILFNRDRVVALFAAALFAVHPVHNEVLSRVAMNENLFGFFMIASIAAYLYDRRHLSLIAFGLALLSKESAVMLPFVVLILENTRSGIRKSLVHVVPYAAVLGLYLLVHTVVLGFFDMSQYSIPTSVKLLTSGSALADYLRLIVIPYPLVALYPPRLYTTIRDPHVLASIAIIGGALFLLWKVRRDRTLAPLLIGGLLFLSLSVMKANDMVWGSGMDMIYIADRQLYVPIALFSLFLSGFAINRSSAIGRQHAVFGASLVIVSFTLILLLSMGMWKNDQSLGSQVVHDSPDSGMAHLYRGSELMEHRSFDAALVEFEAAFHPNPLYHQMADAENIDPKQGNVNWEALRTYRSNYAIVHFLIGQVYLEQGRYDEAIKKFTIVLKIQPQNTEARYYRAKSYLQSGHLDLARNDYLILLNYIKKNYERTT